MPDQTQNLTETVSLEKQFNDLLLDSLTTVNSISDRISKQTQSIKEQIEDRKDLNKKQKEFAKQTTDIEQSIREISALNKLSIRDNTQQLNVIARIAEIETDIKDLFVIRKTLEEELKNETQNHTKDLLTKIPIIGKLISLTEQFLELWRKHPGLALFHISVLAILYTVGGIIAKFIELDRAATAFRKTMGILVDNNQALEQIARDVAFEFQGMGVSGENVYNSFKAIAETIGTSQAYTKEMVADISLMQAQLGIAEKTSAEFLKTMGMIANNTMDSQRNMLFFTQHMAEAGGVKLDDVMNDIAQASKSSYQFLSRDPLVLAKAAVEARRMGTSLESTASSAKSLIDFTSSVKSEMEASVLLGKSLNLQKARELSYHKDILGLNTEILRLAKDVNFEQLDPFQQEAVAKAFGKQAGEVSQLLQSDRERRRIAAITSGPLKVQADEYQRMLKANEATAKAQAESVEHLVKTRSNQEAIRSITLAWHSIVQSLASIFLPAISNTMRGIADWMNTASLTTKKWIAGLVVVGALLTGVIFIGLNKIANVLIGKLIGGPGKGAQSFLTGLARGLNTLGKVSWASIGKGILVLAGLGAALIPLAIALKMMEGVTWKTLAIAGVAIIGLTGALIGLGFLFMSPAGIAIGAGIAALVLMGLSLIPLAYVFDKVADSMVRFSSGLKTMSDSLVQLKGMDFISTSMGVWALARAFGGLGRAIADIPEVSFQRLDKIGAIAVNTKDDKGAVTNVAASPSNALIDEIKGLRADLLNGKLVVHVYLDPQKSAVASGRFLELVGNEKPGRQ